MLNKSLLVERTQHIELYFINRQPIEGISKFWVMTHESFYKQISDLMTFS